MTMTDTTVEATARFTTTEREMMAAAIRSDARQRETEIIRWNLTHQTPLDASARVLRRRHVQQLRTLADELEYEERR